MKSPDDIHFSICMPVYNGRRYLAETLASVRAQTHPHWELIVVEDASPEPCRDLVEAFAATVTQAVTYRANPTNLGCARTRDRGFALARHAHLAPLDQDDIWQPEHLAVLARDFADGDPDFVFTGCTTFSHDRNDPGPDFVPQPDMLADLRAAFFFCRYWMQPSSLAFNRRLFSRVGPWSQGLERKPTNLPGHRDMAEDRNFILRAFKAGVAPRWTGQVTTLYRQHADSMRGQDHYNLVTRAWIHNELGLFDGFSRREQRRYLAHVNANAARVLEPNPPYRRLAATFYFRAWCWWPWRLDRLALTVRSWFRARFIDGPS